MNSVNKHNRLQIVWRYAWRSWLASLFALSVILLQPNAAFAHPGDDNHIVVPSDGKITVNFIGTGGPGEPTACEGDFGIDSPEHLLIYPEYLYNAGVQFPVPSFFSQGTEIVFYIDPRGICFGGPYLSTNPARAQITHPDPYTWIIGWEDWTDADFNDLVVQVDFQPATIPFLDLPFEYKDSNFVVESHDTEQGGKVNAYFDHQYPTYSTAPNSPGPANTVNFNGYDSSQTDPLPPYRITYDGHDGVDYLIKTGTPVLAAATGEVIFADKITAYCDATGRNETANVVKLRHLNGYTTEYWHLSSFADITRLGTTLHRDASKPIGFSGNTGCSTGPHLHFLVRNASGIVVDPYSWWPLPDAAWYGKTDPWQQFHADHGGSDATSHYLWQHQLITGALLSSSTPTNIASPSGNATATFPVGAYATALRIQMAESLQSASIAEYRSLYSFSLFAYSAEGLPVTELMNAASISVQLPASANSASLPNDAGNPVFQVWDVQSTSWQQLPTEWDPVTRIARAPSQQIGTFALTIRESRLFLPLIGVDTP